MFRLASPLLVASAAASAAAALSSMLQPLRSSSLSALEDFSALAMESTPALPILVLASLRQDRTLRCVEKVESC